MKIAHLSDLHICSRHKPQNIERTEKLVRLAYESDIDHLIITGDISQNSYAEDFEILRQILISYDFLSSEKTSLVIGNHDIFGGVHLAEDIITFPTKCTNINFQERVNRFSIFFKETFDDIISKSDSSYFPYVKVYNKFILIGLNSNTKYSKVSNIAGSNGKIESDDYLFLNKLLYKSEFKNKIKILCLHHHIADNLIKFNNKTWKVFDKYTMKLRGKRKLFKFLKDNSIDLVLHGHVHQNYSYNLSGIHFLNGGASTESDLDTEMRINFIELYNNKIKYTINSLTDIEPKKEQIIPEQSLIPSFV